MSRQQVAHAKEKDVSDQLEYLQEMKDVVEEIALRPRMEGIREDGVEKRHVPKEYDATSTSKSALKKQRIETSNEDHSD